MKKNWIKIVLVSTLLIIIFGVLPVLDRLTGININEKSLSHISIKLYSSSENLKMTEGYEGEIKNLVNENISNANTLQRVIMKSQYEYMCYFGIVIGVFFLILGILSRKKKEEKNISFSNIMYISGTGVIILHIITRIMTMVTIGI